MSTIRRQIAVAFLRHMLPDEANGYLCLAYKSAEHLDKSQDGPMRSTWFRWPKDLTNRRIGDWIEDRIDKDQPFFWCPSLFGAKTRSRGASVWRRYLWVDLDANIPSGDDRWDLVDDLNATMIRSGRRGHRHIYVTLAGHPHHPRGYDGWPRSRPYVDGNSAGWLDTDNYHAYRRAFRDAMGAGADAKIADNDLMRLPGSLNYRTTPPTLVKIVKKFDDGARFHIDRDGLTRLLGPATVRPADRTDDTGIVPEDVDEARLPGAVNAAFWDRSHADDRSKATYWLIKACQEHGLTAGQALTIALEHEPTRDKLGSNSAIAKAVHRIWSKGGAA